MGQIRLSNARRRVSRVLALGLCACGLLAGVGGNASAGRTTVGTPSARAQADKAVYRALADQAWVPVLVAVRGDAGSPRTLANVAARRALLATLRARVLKAAGDGFRLTHEWGSVPVFAGRVNRAGLGRLLARPEVLRIDPDQPVVATLSRSVPLIRADQVHATGVTGKGVTVAVLDTGIDTVNSDLSDDIVGQRCFAINLDGSSACPGGPNVAQDDNGHGTGVAGIITSRGAVAARGVAPDAKILAVKVLNRDGKLPGSAPVISALEWILDARPDVKVINMSLGSSSLLPGDCDGARADAIAYASLFEALRSRGTTVFAASGNDASVTQMSAPACVSAAISVGATYDAAFGGISYPTAGCADSSPATDLVACFSNSDSALDLLAPGALITVPKLGGGTEVDAGTSQAAPHAAGVAALMLQSRPDLTSDQIRSALQQTGVPVGDVRNGITRARIDALGAVNGLGTLPHAPPPEYLPASATSFTDPTGDAGAGVDIGAVEISSTDSGVLTFRVTTPNRTALSTGDEMEMYVDVNRNATIDAGDYAIGAYPSGLRELFRYDGSTWTFIRLITDGSYAGGVLTFSVTESELKIVGDFDVWTTSSFNQVRMDNAPDNRTWPFPASNLTVAKTGSGTGAVSGPSGTIDCGSTCSFTFARAANITLTTAPAAGSVFVEWSGECTGVAACILSMTTSRSVTARFEALRQVKVTRAGAGSGTITSAPGGISCGSTCSGSFANGTSVALTAQPDPGSKFGGWSGGCTSADQCTIAVGGDTAVTATFRDVQAPSSKALPSSAKAGARGKLRFRLADNSGFARAKIVVRNGSKRLAQLTRALGPTGAGSVVYATPRSLGKKRLSFCVTAVDASGNTGTPACASLQLR